jgi:NitT/TauT family transport system substrate-binding protein
MQIIQSRRDFLAGLSAAGAVSALGARASLADEGPPEVTTIRLTQDPNICVAPGYIAEDLLRAEGFTEIRYVASTSDDPVARSEVDFDMVSGVALIAYLDAGQPLTALAGIHSGCYELFAHEPIRTVSDLKGKRIAIRRLNHPGHYFVAIMAAQVGLDPQTDIEWVTSSEVSPMELFADGKADAFLGFPPEPQELRDRRIGRVILDTATDRPWSQYLCCMVYGNREWVRNYPVATKRFLRAALKAADICATEPEKAARSMVEDGFTPHYDYALQTLTELPYDRWREFDPEDAMRFYGLRLHEVGMLNSSPNALIAEGTDWRFVNELKRELKA